MNDDRLACRRRALDLLARREHSPAELERKLLVRGFDASVVGDTLAELTSEGLLASARFAESFIRNGISRGHGPVRLRMALREHGIDDADRVLGEAGCDWAELARATRVRRFGAALPESYRDKAKQARFLEYRGFTAEQVRHALESEGAPDPG